MALSTYFGGIIGTIFNVNNTGGHDAPTDLESNQRGTNCEITSPHGAAGSHGGVRSTNIPRQGTADVWTRNRSEMTNAGVTAAAITELRRIVSDRSSIYPSADSEGRDDIRKSDRESAVGVPEIANLLGFDDETQHNLEQYSLLSAITAANFDRDDCDTYSNMYIEDRNPIDVYNNKLAIWLLASKSIKQYNGKGKPIAERLCEHVLERIKLFKSLARVTGNEDNVLSRRRDNELCIEISKQCAEIVNADGIIAETDEVTFYMLRGMGAITKMSAAASQGGSHAFCFEDYVRTEVALSEYEFIGIALSLAYGIHLDPTKTMSRALLLDFLSKMSTSINCVVAEDMDETDRMFWQDYGRLLPLNETETLVRINMDLSSFRVRSTTHGNSGLSNTIALIDTVQSRTSKTLSPEVEEYVKAEGKCISIAARVSNLYDIRKVGIEVLSAEKNAAAERVGAALTWAQEGYVAYHAMPFLAALVTTLIALWYGAMSKFLPGMVTVLAGAIVIDPGPRQSFWCIEMKTMSIACAAYGVTQATSAVIKASTEVAEKTLLIVVLSLATINLYVAVMRWRFWGKEYDPEDKESLAAATGIPNFNRLGVYIPGMRCVNGQKQLGIYTPIISSTSKEQNKPGVSHGGIAVIWNRYEGYAKLINLDTKLSGAIFGARLRGLTSRHTKTT